MIELPLAWILATIGTLATVIATLAGIIYHSLSARIAVQDLVIAGLRNDIERMAKGCGMDGCHWRLR